MQYLCSRNQNLTLQRSHSHVFDEDSNSSWTSTGSRKRTRPHPSSPLKCHASSRDGSSDSEEETEKCRKVGPSSNVTGRLFTVSMLQSLSREERKTEQVWRVFEKMEASAQRKRQHLLSEGSHDSDHLSSPPLHPLGGGRGQKDRRSSSSSRKAQMLSKM